MKKPMLLMKSFVFTATAAATVAAAAPAFAAGEKGLSVVVRCEIELTLPTKEDPSGASKTSKSLPTTVEILSQGMRMFGKVISYPSKGDPISYDEITVVHDFTLRKGLTVQMATPEYAVSLNLGENLVVHAMKREKTSPSGSSKFGNDLSAARFASVYLIGQQTSMITAVVELRDESGRPSGKFFKGLTTSVCKPE